MRYSALSAIALLLIGVGAGRAQQLTKTSAESASTNVPVAMTPIQVAELLMARKEYSEAASAYQKILAGKPDDPEVLNQIGIAYQQLTDFNHAERFYKQAIRANRNFSSAINNLGTVEYDKRRYGSAVKYYRKALALDPAVATIYSNLGYAYFASRKYPQAMDAFGKALAIDPAVFEHRSNGGTIVQQRSITDPGMFHFFLAKTYALMGDAEQAAHFLKVARDDGYAKYESARKDPAFARVIKDPRVQQVLEGRPAYATESAAPAVN